MIKYFICLIVILACTNLHAQNIQDFKTKNSANQKERTAMLDLLRAKMKKSLKIECSYVVEHFKVSSNYAWMRLIIWMVIGLVLYFVYGAKHSVIRKNAAL